MSALRIKLLRDLRRLWAQALAIALVLAAGVATMILGTGAYQSLSNTRADYYAESRFADIFVTVKRAPKDVAADIANLEGVAEAEPRIAELALADLPGIREPASVMLISLPEDAGPSVSRLILRTGRMPEAGSANEVIVSESFGKAAALAPGAELSVLLNGVRRSLKVVGWALSPEYIYTIGPGDLMPDERRFGILWMSERELAGAYNLHGAFSSLVIRVVPGARQQQVIEAVDSVLKKYGGQGAYGRKDQTSHAFLDAELRQLRTMSRILPPIFLLVSAFLVNMTLSRLITLEREQIGLLKSLGYSSWAVARHYVEFVAVIGLLGSLMGVVAGWWLGTGLAELYARFFRFPHLLFSRDPSVYGISVLLSLAAAVAGALKAAFEAANLSPATAMSPPAPARYRKLLGGMIELAPVIGQAAVMNVRHLGHWPWRTAGGILGLALAVGVLVGSLWSFGSVRYLVDLTFNRIERQDASIQFPQALPMAAYFSVRRMPGVIQAEPFRAVAAEAAFGSRKRRVSLVGKSQEAELSRMMDEDMRVVAMPEKGVVISSALAGVLGARRGDKLRFSIFEGSRQTIELPVSAIVQGYFGLGAYMDMGALNKALQEGALVSGVNVTLDASQQQSWFEQLKTTPATRFVALQKTAERKFKETLAQNLSIMMSVFVTLGAIIAFGVVYNLARISLSEQGREMASLRVLGFTRAEVFWLLVAEIGIVVIAAQPFGWLAGYGFAHLMIQGFSTELYRVPAIIEPSVYAYASLTVLTATVLSLFIVRGRIDRLDMIAVLKTRE